MREDQSTINLRRNRWSGNLRAGSTAKTCREIEPGREGQNSKLQTSKAEQHKTRTPRGVSREISNSKLQSSPCALVIWVREFFSFLFLAAFGIEVLLELLFGNFALHAVGGD